MEGFLIRSVVAVALSAAIAARAYKGRSLDLSGTILGFLVMAIHIAAGYRFGALLLVFFFTSSKLTKIGQEKKRLLAEDFKEGGQRNWHSYDMTDTWLELILIHNLLKLPHRMLKNRRWV